MYQPSLTPTPSTLGRQEHLTFKGNHGRHAWLRLTPAYSVHLVEQLVAAHGHRGPILDPFCGTGTTALVCAQRCIRCDTVDINPFLIWLATAKTSAYSPDAISRARTVLEDALSGRRTHGGPSWLPPIHDINKWWDHPDILAELSAVFAHFKGAEPPACEWNLLAVTFCRAAIQLAAVSFGHQSMSFKKAALDTLPLFSESPRARVAYALRQAFADISASANDGLGEGLAHAILGDARSLGTFLKPGHYTAVITSPPYPNRMSYIRELRPYMYWLGYLSSGREAGELDWRAIGGTWGCATSNLTKWTPDPAMSIPDPKFLRILDAIGSRSTILATYVHKYFEDTVRHVAALRPTLRAGATVHYVVGNSRFYDVILPTERLYASIFDAHGFRSIGIETIRKRTSKKELFEFVVSATRA